MIIKIKTPENGSLLIKGGDKINFNQPFFKKSLSQDILINLAEELKINPKKIFNCLKKFVGDPVKKDDLIAIHKDFFSTKKVVSPVNGIIKEINHQNGTITIKTEKDEKNIFLADFQGEVQAIKNNQIELRVKKLISSLIDKTDKNIGGQCLYLTENSTIITDFNTIIIENKIIITTLINEILITKLDALGAKTIITNKSLNHSQDNKTLTIKNIDFWQKVIKEKLPYCYIDGFSSTIYFYQ